MHWVTEWHYRLDRMYRVPSSSAHCYRCSVVCLSVVLSVCLCLSVCWTGVWAVQNRLNWSRWRLVCRQGNRIPGSGTDAPGEWVVLWGLFPSLKCVSLCKQQTSLHGAADLPAGDSASSVPLQNGLARRQMTSAGTMRVLVKVLWPLVVLYFLSSVLWHCWLGGRKGIRPVKTEWWGTGVVVCLERDADLHMAQLMPLPLTVPEKGPLNRCVVVLFLSRVCVFQMWPVWCEFAADCRSGWEIWTECSLVSGGFTGVAWRSGEQWKDWRCRHSFNPFS